MMDYVVRVVRIGNSARVTIPKKIAEKVLRDCTYVLVKAKEQHIEVVPATISEEIQRGERR